MGEMSSALIGKPQGKRPLGRTKGRWENNIKISLQEMFRRIRP
jgi:hypothetical protein